MQETIKSGAETYSSAIANAHNYMQWVLEPFLPYLRGTIMEVGIGHGSYFTELTRYGEYVGVDIDSQSVVNARSSHALGIFAVADIGKKDFWLDFLPEKADCIVSVNVLEHIEDDRTAVENLVEALKPGGHLLISLPALMLLYNDLDRLAGHYRRYSLDGLRRIFSGMPVDIVQLRYFNPLGGFGWWVNKFKRHKSLNDSLVNSQIAFFDQYMVPISKLLDPVFRGFFGQSVTCIVRRQ